LTQDCCKKARTSKGKGNICLVLGFFFANEERALSYFYFIILIVVEKILHLNYIYLQTFSCYGNVRPIAVIQSHVSFNWDSTFLF